jgi:hypothetical protein
LPNSPSGGEPVFPKKDQAIDYAENRAAKKLLFHYKSPWAVKKYAVRLMPEFYEHLNPMPFEAAAQMDIGSANIKIKLAFTNQSRLLLVGLLMPVAKSLIGEAWTKCCFTPTINTGPTFNTTVDKWVATSHQRSLTFWAALLLTLGFFLQVALGISDLSSSRRTKQTGDRGSA